MVGLSDAGRLAAAFTVAALVERPGWGRLVGTGPDLLDLLHRLSTADLKALGPGEGRPAVLTSPKGRIVEAISVHHLGAEGLLILCGPGGAARVLAHLERYTFSERTGLADVTDATAGFSIVGPAFAAAAEAAGLPSVPPYGAARAAIAGAPATVVGTSGFDGRGATVVVPIEAAELVRACLAAAVEGRGGATLDETAAEAWRVLSGHPLAGHELTEDWNPLEAGLTDAISFTKGCYVGQEVVARLNTYDKVARGLVRLEMRGADGPPPPGARVTLDGREIGIVTSSAPIPGRDAVAALAYVRRRDVPDERSSVSVEGPQGPREAAIRRS